MRRLLIALAAFGLVAPPAIAGNDGWVPVGFNVATGQATFWIKARNAERINNEAFKVMVRNAESRESLAKINCKNKDIGFKVDGYKWQQIGDGSVGQAIGSILCKHGAYRDRWGYPEETEYLWNIQAPDGDPADAGGEWVEHRNNDREEIFYSDDVKTDGKLVLYAAYMRQKKIDQGAGTQREDAKYWWVLADCNSSKYSAWLPFGDEYLKGTWSPPQSGAPNGTARAVRKKFCATPNREPFEVLPTPTIQTLRQFAD